MLKHYNFNLGPTAISNHLTSIFFHASRFLCELGGSEKPCFFISASHVQDGQWLHGVASGSKRATERGQHCEHSVEADAMKLSLKMNEFGFTWMRLVAFIICIPKLWLPPTLLWIPAFNGTNPQPTASWRGICFTFHLTWVQHQIKTGQMCFHTRPSNQFQIINTFSTFFKPDPNVFGRFTSPSVVEVYRAGARSDAATYRNRTALHFSANAAVVEVKIAGKLRRALISLEIQVPNVLRSLIFSKSAVEI